jgi:Family of unknown function (DUF6504)
VRRDKEDEEVGMVRRYDDPIDVRRNDEEPGQFVWRGRLYVVRGVLAHWVESGRWWRTASARAVYGADATGGTEAGVPDRTEGGAGAAPAVVDDGEREIWRVEAASGRHAGTGVYDLCFHWSAGAWTLLRTQD